MSLAACCLMFGSTSAHNAQSTLKYDPNAENQKSESFISKSCQDKNLELFEIRVFKKLNFERGEDILLLFQSLKAVDFGLTEAKNHTKKSNDYNKRGNKRKYNAHSTHDCRCDINKQLPPVLQ
jgi:hypothetical protein